MTEKRFIFNGLHIRDTLNIIPPIMTHNEEQRDKFLNGLNKLSDENKELKQSIHDWQGSYDDLYEDNLKLEKENKELKAMCEDYRKLSIQYSQKYNEKISDNTFLEEENTHIKNTIKQAYNNERTTLGKNILKQLMEQIQ